MHSVDFRDNKVDAVRMPSLFVEVLLLSLNPVLKASGLFLKLCFLFLYFLALVLRLHVVVDKLFLLFGLERADGYYAGLGYRAYSSILSSLVEGHEICCGEGLGLLHS